MRCSGRGGTGGILNRVTKKAEVGSRFSQLTGYADSFGAGGLCDQCRSEDSVALRVNAMAEGPITIGIILMVSESVSIRR